MFDEIRNLFNITLGEDVSELWVLAAQKLYDAGYESHLPAMRDHIALNSQGSAIDAMDAVRGQIIRSYAEVFRGFGIVLNIEDIKPTVLTGTLDTLMYVQECNDIDSIAAIVDNGETTELTMSDLVQFATPLRAEDVVDHYDEVSSSLIDRIVETVINNVEADTGEDGVVFDNSFQVNRVRQFLERYPDVELMSLIENGVRIGMSLDTYLPTVLNRLDEPSVEDVVKEVTACVLASDIVSDDAVIKTIIDNVDGYLSDPTVTPSIKGHLDRLLENVGYAKT